MKAQLRIPMKEPYAYIELSVDDTPEGILEAYQSFTALLEAPVALQKLSEAEFRPILDKFLTEGTVESGLYEQMSPEQQMVMQCIKRSIKRIKSRE